MQRQVLRGVRVLLSGVVFAALAAGQDPVPQPDKPAQGTPQPEVVKQESVAKTVSISTAVAVARKAEKDCKGLRGPAREAAMKRAAEAWCAVARLGDEQGDASAGARGHYQAGLVHRRRGALAEAEAEFVACLKIDKGRYKERALYEQAQVLRRRKKFDEAAASYRAASTVNPTSSRAAEARLWIGRCLSAKGDHKAAIESLRVALESAERPKFVIKTTNYLAREMIVVGDLDGAEAAIAHAEQATTDDRAQGGKVGARIQKMLDGMSARRELRRARDKREAVGEQADRVVEAQEGGAGR